MIQDIIAWTIMVLLIVAIVAAFGLSASMERHREEICIEHGYERAERLGGQYVCIGVRGGNTIVTPLDQVKEIK